MPAPRLFVRPVLLGVSRPALFLRFQPAPTIVRYRFLSHTRPLRDEKLPPQNQQDPYDRLRDAKPLVSNRAAGRFTRAGTSRNSRLFVVATVLAALGFYLYNSQTVPVTGRRRFNFLSDSMVARAHSKAAGQIIEQVKAQGGHFLGDWDPRTILVKRVMKRLIPVSGMTDLNWEIYVIADSRMLSCCWLSSFGLIYG